MAPDALESKIRAAFAAESLRPQAWSNGPHFRYGVHSHSTHKLLYVVKGSMTFYVHHGAEKTAREMKAGDRLDLPPHTEHSADVGPEGVTCWEAHRKVG